MPLFVRLPEAQVRRLDDHVSRSGRSKQEVVGQLLAASMEQVEAHGLGPASSPTAATGLPLVHTVDEVAAILRVDAEEVASRVESGDLPARRFGDGWRIGHDALVHWLGESDVRRTAGFRRAD